MTCVGQIAHLIENDEFVEAKLVGSFAGLSAHLIQSVEFEGAKLAESFADQ